MSRADQTFFCPTCEQDLEYDEYHLSGDSGIIKVISVLTKPCACTVSCCTFCETPLDDGDHCDNQNCWAWTLIIPLPVQGPKYQVNYREYRRPPNPSRAEIR